jgi:signal transduction histidine kinase
MLIPFVLTALAVYYLVIRTYEIGADEEKNTMVAEAAVSLRKVQDAARNDIELIANLPSTAQYLRAPDSRPDSNPTGANSDEADLKTILQLFADQNAYCLQLSLVDARGQERIKYSKLPGGQGLASVKGTDYFRRTLIQGAFRSPVEMVRPGRYASVMTQRVRREKFLGAVVLHLNADAFQTSLRPLLASHGLSTFLFDDRGLVFAKSLAGADEESFLQQVDLAKEASALLAMSSLESAEKKFTFGNRSFQFSVMPAGAASISVFEQQSGDNWFLGVLEPREAIGRTAAFQIAFFTILLVAVGAVLLAATRYARHVTVPLEQVADATSRIAQGQLDIDLRVKTGDEVEDLALAVKRMADDLKRYHDELVRSAKLATIGEMASEISHEIQNRISGVSLWTQYLDAELDRDDPKREYLEEMKQGLRGFSGLLDDLKQFYRTPKLCFAPAHLNDLVTASLPSVEQRIKERHISVKLDLDPALPEVLCDGEKIKSVILNLVLNAIEAVPDEGLIEIKTAAARPPAPDGRAGPTEIKVSVRDNGCGIAEQDLPRIFYPFYSTKGSGSGLGLAIASNIVSAHGGKIEVESRVGGGTTFTVSLAGASSGA